MSHLLHLRKAAFAVTVLALLGLVSVITARADLVHLGTTNTLGSAVTGQTMLLGFQGQAQPAPSALILRSGNADFLFTAPGTLVSGGLNTRTHTFAEAGITSASEFRLILNINEPDDLLTVTRLEAYFYRPDGSLLHTAAYAGAQRVFDEAGSGAGGSGQVFGLSSTEEALIQAAFSSNIRVGLGAFHANEGGGFDTYYIARGAGAEPIPEPATILLLGTGLVGVAAKVRRQYTTQSGREDTSH